MAFCEKCGKELGPDGVCDCQKVSEAPAASTETAASAAPTENTAPAASAEAAANTAPAAPATPVAPAVPEDKAPNNNKLIGIIAVAAVAVIALIVIFALAGGSSYKTPFKDLQSLINKQSTDVFAYSKVIKDPVTAKFVKSVYDVTKSSDDVKEDYEDMREELKDFYDDLDGFKITKIELKKAKKMKDKELKDFKKYYDPDNYEDLLENLDDMDSDDIEDLADMLDISKSAAKKLVKEMKSYYKSMGKAKVQEGYTVDVIVRAKYDGDEDKTDRIEVQVLKINGKWYIYNASSFLRSIVFDKDLEDVSLRDLYNLINFNVSGF